MPRNLAALLLLLFISTLMLRTADRLSQSNHEKSSNLRRESINAMHLSHIALQTGKITRRYRDQTLKKRVFTNLCDLLIPTMTVSLPQTCENTALPPFFTRELFRPPSAI